MAQGDLLGWANSIRLNMASDSGRQFFQKQVQAQGFLFLDDYLDNILSGTKQDPLVELLKTPGRRKTVAKKPKTASKLANPIFFSLGSKTDENDSPVESSTSRAPISLEDEPKKPEPLLAEPKPRSVFGETDSSTNSAPEKRAGNAPMDTVPEIESMPLNQETAPVDQADLSVIAEDDEPAERSRMSIVAPSNPSPKISSNKRSLPDAPIHPSQEESAPEPPAKVARTESLDKEISPPRAIETPKISSRSEAPSEYHSTRATPSSPLPPSLPNSSITEHLEPTKVPSEESSSEKAISRSSGQQTVMLETELTTRVSDTMDIQVPLKDADATTRRRVIPSLPEPMPLRKSLRVLRDPSLGGVMMGAATPGGPAGKRTSWLIKAREAKALDKTVKGPSAFPQPSLAVPVAQSSKRKSGDLDAFAPPGIDREPKSKVAKHAEGDNPSSKKVPNTKASPPPAQPREPSPAPAIDHEALTFEPANTSGVLGLLRKTVEGLVGKPAANSGKDAMSALAEAKAAAEARIAARDHQDDPPPPAGKAVSDEKMNVDPATSPAPRPMNIADLFPADGRMKDKGKAPEKPFQFFPPPLKKQEPSAHRDSTTPPHSPPAPASSTSFVGANVALFKKSPVFVPPAVAARPLPSPPGKSYAFQPPKSVFTAMNSPFGSPRSKAPLATNSEMDTVPSQRMFDDEDAPTWVPPAQDTEYTEGFGDTQMSSNTMDICDDDDSWPVDGKMAQGWAFGMGGGMSDSTTGWSSLASKSHRSGDTNHYTHDKTTSSLRNVDNATGDHTRDKTTSSLQSIDNATGNHTRDKTTSSLRNAPESSDNRNKMSAPEPLVPGAFQFELAQEPEPVKEVEKVQAADEEFEDAVLGSIRLVPQENKSFRPQSQMSMAASSSSQETQSQSQGGFINQASKLFNSALGAGKKKQPEVKNVLNKAAAAAKKQQEEADKKAARLKEMENRRQQAIQKKAEEERAKKAEEERKLKEDMERRKREREELAEKQRAFKATPIKKADDTQTQKMGIPEKKAELKKTSSIQNLGKSQLKPAIKPSILHKAAVFSGSSQAGSSKAAESSSKVPKFAPSSSQNNKGKAKATAMSEDELGQPSQFLQEQMAARAKEKIQAAKHLVPSESIELPDVNSEYSDSDDEDRKRTYDPPDWAQSPELKEALKNQSTINPDDIFGAVRPLKMEEIFKTRTSRFRARTSSANWTGADRLTMAEQVDYANRMGFK